MAQKKQRPSPIDDPPTASSSDSSEHEEEDHRQPSSEEEEEVSTQEEEGDDHQPSSLPPAPSNPKPSSSESDTDTDSEPAKPKPKPKPKPVDQAQKPKPQPSPAPPRSGLKRPAENNNAHPKRAKNKPTGAPSSSAADVASDEEVEDDGKKSGSHTKLFQRFWSEEDELAILKGMAEYISKTGQDPYKYADAFHKFVKKSLHVEASHNQLKEKIRRLKKKFETNARRGKNGEDPKFSKPHDQTAFELSRKVWAEGPNGLVEKPKPNGKSAKTPKKKATITNVSKPETKTPPLPPQDPEESGKPADLEESGKPDSGDVSGDVSSLYREISGFKELDEDEMKRGLTLIGESKRKELEGKWKKLRHAEIELVANRSLLVGEQLKLIFESLQSSNQ